MKDKKTTTELVADARARVIKLLEVMDGYEESATKNPMDMGAFVRSARTLLADLILSLNFIQESLPHKEKRHGRKQKG